MCACAGVCVGFHSCSVGAKGRRMAETAAPVHSGVLVAVLLLALSFLVWMVVRVLRAVARSDAVVRALAAQDAELERQQAHGRRMLARGGDGDGDGDGAVAVDGGEGRAARRHR